MADTRKLVTNHTVNVRRDSGKKDKDGNPIFQRIQIPPGKLFEFTFDEADAIMRMGTDALRPPRNESRSLSRQEAYDLASGQARSVGGAPKDAGNVAATGAMGENAPSDSELKAAAHLKSVATPAEDDEDL